MNNEWISVKERLPELNVDVLVFRKSGLCFTAHIIERNGNWWMREVWYGQFDDVTHWLPLPAPPQPGVIVGE